MDCFEISAKDISDLNDADLRELIGRLCEAEITQQNLSTSCVFWGGAQEAGDGGVDVRVNCNISLNCTNQGFIPHANTIFQVKKHSMSKEACKKEMLSGKQVKPSIEELTINGGAYIIVSGKDNCSEKMLNERIAGMREAVSGLQQKENLQLDFYGADRLATWIRKFPSVTLWARSKLSKPLSGWIPFGRWATAQKELDDEFLLDDNPCITDLSTNNKTAIPILEGIQLVREKLSRKGNSVRIVGLSGVGKTRFAQALFEPNIGEDILPQTNVIYADLGCTLEPTASKFVSYLIANSLEAFVVLDNCPPDIHRELQKLIAQENAKLSLLTIEYDISDDQPEGTDVIQLDPSSEKLISRLIQKRYPNLNELNADKIAEFSGGNARIAIALADRVEPDETLMNLTDNELFLRLFHQRKDKSEKLLESAELLSLVYSCNLKVSKDDDELNALALIGGVERKQLYRDQAELLRRQLAQQRGDWRAVLPHAIANRLANRALENIVIEDINRELFKEGNFRLFKSCAHRLGYLHGSSRAEKLAKSWLQEDAPLHDITKYNGNLFSVFEYIAPLFPEVILKYLEDAFDSNTDFSAESTPNFSGIAYLLRKIAYDIEYFDRATLLILKFVEKEDPDNRSNNVIDCLKGLFSLYLSGTMAPPIQRQIFFRNNISFINPNHLWIAEALFDSIFETSNWSSGFGFEFGARARGFGWQPETNKEKIEWYQGFLEILWDLLKSDDINLQKWAKSMIAKKFNDLWTYAGCFDLLIAIINEQVKDDSWPEMYLSIKNTLFFNGEKFSPDIKEKLQELEVLTAPNDLRSEIEHYVLTNSWDLWYEYTETDDKTERQSSRAFEIGRQAFHDQELLSKLIPRFLQSAKDLQVPFGKGLAQEAHNKKEFFSFLLEEVIANHGLIRNCCLLEGFIQEVYEQNISLAKEFQLQILDRAELKYIAIHLLVICPLDSGVISLLITLAESEKMRAWDFSILASGGRHEAISDLDLVSLLEAINKLENGIQTVVHILKMRFFRFERTDYQPSEGILSFSRGIIKKILSLNYNEIQTIQNFDTKTIAEACLTKSTNKIDIHEVIEVLFSHIHNSLVIDFNGKEVLAVLLKNFPSIFLEKAFNVFVETERYIFNKTITKRIYISDFVGVKELLEWCDGNQLKIQFVVKSIFAFQCNNKVDTSPYGDEDISQPVMLSEHMRTFLEVVEDKGFIIDAICEQLHPRRWSGSEADIIENRSIVLNELLSHESVIVRELVKKKIEQCKRLIKNIRQKELEDHNKREQRFE